MYIRRSETHQDTGSQIVRRPPGGHLHTDVPVLDLPPHVRQALADSVPAETRRKYDMWFGKANRWCQADPWALANGVTVLPMPTAAFTTWIQFLTTVVSERTGLPYSVASLNQAVAAVVSYHEAVGESPPSTREARKLIRDHGGRIAREVKRSSILTPDQILDVVRLPQCTPRAAASARDALVAARNRFLAVVSFSAWNRRSEFAAAELSHFGVVQEPIPDDPEGRTQSVLRWRFPKSKTDQAGEGADVFMPATGDDLCPVDAFTIYRVALAGRGIVGGRALRSIDRWGNVGDGMTGHSVNVLSKALVRAAGHGGTDGYGRTFTAQGWRASGYSAATKAGAAAEAKRKHGRWSETSGVPERVYDRAQSPVADNPMAAVTAARTKDVPMPNHHGPRFRVHRADGGFVDYLDPVDAQAQVDALAGARLEVVQPSYPTDGRRWGVELNDGTQTHMSFPTEDAARAHAALYPGAVVSELAPGAHR